jgi:hypothetical protein
VGKKLVDACGARINVTLVIAEVDVRVGKM